MYLVFNCACAEARGGQKRAQGHLGLELQVVVSWHSGAGDQTLVCWEKQQLLLTPGPSPQTLDVVVFVDPVCHL